MCARVYKCAINNAWWGQGGMHFWPRSPTSTHTHTTSANYYGKYRLELVWAIVGKKSILVGEYLPDQLSAWLGIMCVWIIHAFHDRYMFSESASWVESFNTSKKHTVFSQNNIQYEPNSNSANIQSLWNTCVCIHFFFCCIMHPILKSTRQSTSRLCVWNIVFNKKTKTGPQF
jgi:hypothetical protein